MIDRVRAVADEFVERGIVVKVDGVAIPGAKDLQGRGVDDPVRQAHPGAQHGHVALVSEEIGIDHRRGGGIGAPQPHSAAALGPQYAGVEREAVRLHLFAAVILEHRGDEVPLHVGRGRIGHHRPEPARLGVAGGHHAGALAAVFDDGRRHPQRALERAADRRIAFRLPAGNIVDMVLQIAAHGGTIHHDVDPVGLEMLGRADARQHQDLRRIERACRKNDPATGQQRLAFAPATNRNAGDTPALDNQLFDQRVGAHREIALLADRLHVCPRGRPAFALALGHLVEAEAVLPLAVEVGVGAQLERRGGLDESMRCRVGGGLVGHEQWPARSVIIIAAALVGLGALEVGQHVVIAPTGAAFRGPVVVIPAVAADIDHRVDRRGTAEPAPARLVAGAPVQALLRYRFIAIVRLFGDEGHEARRLDPDVVVAPARFEQAHPARSIHGETARDRAAGTATADDDVVETFHDLSLCAGRLGSFVACCNRVSISH